MALTLCHLATSSFDISDYVLAIKLLPALVHFHSTSTKAKELCLNSYLGPSKSTEVTVSDPAMGYVGWQLNYGYG